MFGDEIMYKCRLCWRFIIGISDRQQWPLGLEGEAPVYGLHKGAIGGDPLTSVWAIAFIS